MSKPEIQIKNKDRVPLNLTLIFIALSLGIILLGIYYYNSQKESIILQQENELTTISDYKAKQIETWFDDRIRHANSVLVNNYRINQIRLFLNNPGAPTHKENIAEWFQYFADLYKYKNITLYDNSHNPLINVPVNEYRDYNKEIERIRKSEPINEVKISDLYQNDSASPIHISIYIPIKYTSIENNELTAILVFSADVQSFIFPTLLETPTRYNTMESLIAQKKDDYVLFLNELKFRQQTALKFKIPLSEKDVIAVQATEGKVGITYGKDYRNKEVLACISRIRGTSWLLITKIDLDEIKAPILRRTLLIFLNVLLGIILTGIIISLIWRNQSAKHYRLLYQKEAESRVMAEHYAFLSKYANDIILLKDEDLNIIEANDKALESYGYTKEEFLKLNVCDLRVPELVEGIKKTVEHVKLHGGILFETEHKRKNGSRFPVEVSTRLIDVKGKIFFQSIIRDISERKKNEEIIRKNEILTNAVIQNSPVGITIRSISGELIEFNKAWMDIWGLDEEKVKELEKNSKNKSADERYSYFGKYTQNVINAFKNGESCFIPEIKIDNPYSGKEIHLSIYLYPLKSNGKTERIVTLTTDITEQKKAEEKLKESEEKHRSIIEHSNELFYSHTPDHILTYVSPQSKEFFDCEPEEALINWTNFATDNPVNELGYYLTKKAIETGIAQPSYELELKSKKGRLIWVEAHESPVVENDKTVAIIGSLTNITARKIAEERIYKLNRTYKVLSEINQAIVRVKNEKEFFEQVCKILVEIGKFKMAWFAEHDFGNMITKPLAINGYDEGYTDLIISQSKILLSSDNPYYKEISENKFLVFNDLENDLKFPWRKESVKRGYNSFCVIPLIIVSKRNITISLYSGEYDFFNKKEMVLLTELAADISFALNSMEQEKLRVKAEDELKHSKGQLQMLYETSENLNRSLNIEDTYEVIKDFVSKFMDCEGLIVSEYDSKEQKIFYKAAWIQGEWTETDNVPPIDLAPEGKGILSRVIRSEKSLIINDYMAELKKSKTKFRVDEEGKTYDIDSDRKDSTRSALMVPLKIEGKVIGVLHVISFRKNAYTEEHKKLLESISVHISSAINNATLYRLAREEINERKRTEDKLRHSEERFSLSFKLSPIPMCLTKLSDGTFLDTNDAFEKLLGYTHKELMALKLVDISVWENEPREKTIAILKSKGLIKEKGIRTRNKEGREIDTLTTMQILNIGGEDCILSMVQDITQKKKSEEQLRKLSRAVDQSPASIVITDTNGNIEYVNSKFTEVTGFTYIEAIGQNPRILKSGETPDEVYKELWQTISSGKEWHGELHNKKKNGELFWEWASISPILDIAGKITNYLAVKEDITVQKVVQQQIQFQAILMENISDAIIYADKNHIIKSWNRAAEELYGWKAEEILEKKGPDFLRTRFVDTDQDSVLQTMSAKGNWTGELIEYKKNGKPINILASYSFVRDSNREITGYLSVNRDITILKNSEEKIKASLKEKEILLKEIHHRVKNNLQVISSLLKMQADYFTDPVALEYFKISSQRVKSMALIHEQLYRSADLSSIDFHNYVKKLTTHLYQTYGISMSMVKMNIDIKNIRLSIDTAIPCGLLINELISNSLKHGFPEGKKGKIEVEMKKEGSMYMLSIKDSGAGFPSNIDFKNTETLGMQLINTLTEQIDGKIELKRDGGTEFIVTFKSSGYKERI